MHMVDLMSSIICEGDTVSQELLDTVLVNLVPAHKVRAHEWTMSVECQQRQALNHVERIMYKHEGWSGLPALVMDHLDWVYSYTGCWLWKWYFLRSQFSETPAGERGYCSEIKSAQRHPLSDKIQITEHTISCHCWTKPAVFNWMVFFLSRIWINKHMTWPKLCWRGLPRQSNPTSPT